MGNLLNGVSFKEPTTVEECDSTWETDSGGEDESWEPEKEEEEAGKDAGEEDGKHSAAEERGAEGTAGDSHQNCTNTAEQNIKPKRSFYAARDLYKYRHQYPQNIKDLRCQNDLCNLRFYMNKIPFKPDGVFIEEILNKWKSDYDKLEHNHTYIQWLFPLREQGLNFYAKELTSYEIEEFKKTKEAMKRFIMAYKIMLDFFGLKLVDKIGKVSRAANWQERFQHLNESQHNYLRITRILKSLGELGYEHFKPPLVKVFLQESIIENTIPNMKQSALEYFVYTIKEKRERRRLLRYARLHYHPPEHFIWGPPMKQKIQQNKSIKKTVQSSQSVKRHSQKLKDVKTEPEMDMPNVNSPGESLLGTAEEEETKQEIAETGPVDKLVEDNENKLEANYDSKLRPAEPNNLHTNLDETTNASLCVDELVEQNTENLSNGNLDNIVIVVSTDEGGKDCLCSLSPAAPATADSTAPPEDRKLEKEDKAT